MRCKPPYSCLRHFHLIGFIPTPSLHLALRTSQQCQTDVSRCVLLFPYRRCTSLLASLHFMISRSCLRHLLSIGFIWLPSHLQLTCETHGPLAAAAVSSSQLYAPWHSHPPPPPIKELVAIEIPVCVVNDGHCCPSDSPYWLRGAKP